MKKSSRRKHRVRHKVPGPAGELFLQMRAISSTRKKGVKYSTLIDGHNPRIIDTTVDGSMTQGTDGYAMTQGENDMMSMSNSNGLLLPNNTLLGKIMSIQDHPAWKSMCVALDRYTPCLSHFRSFLPFMLQPAQLHSLLRLSIGDEFATLPEVCAGKHDCVVRPFLVGFVSEVLLHSHCDYTCELQDESGLQIRGWLNEGFVKEWPQVVEVGTVLMLQNTAMKVYKKKGVLLQNGNLANAVERMLLIGEDTVVAWWKAEDAINITYEEESNLMKQRNVTYRDTKEYFKQLLKQTKTHPKAIEFGKTFSSNTEDLPQFNQGEMTSKTNFTQHNENHSSNILISQTDQDNRNNFSQYLDATKQLRILFSQNCGNANGINESNGIQNINKSLTTPSPQRVNPCKANVVTNDLMSSQVHKRRHHNHIMLSQFSKESKYSERNNGKSNVRISDKAKEIFDGIMSPQDTTYHSRGTYSPSNYPQREENPYLEEVSKTSASHNSCSDNNMTKFNNIENAKNDYCTNNVKNLKVQKRTSPIEGRTKTMNQKTANNIFEKKIEFYDIDDSESEKEYCNIIKKKTETKYRCTYGKETPFSVFNNSTVLETIDLGDEDFSLSD